MWWAIVVLVCLDALSSQTLTQQVSDALALIECCPCPGSERAALDALGPTTQVTGNAVLGRAIDVDDCPCRVRDADSDGAPSAILPRVLYPLRPEVKLEDKSEDVKPLLHPEVGLASSVLETLRDATEEEYQEALARYAARNAARASEYEPARHVTDPGNSDIVTIIVNPKAGEEDDVIISEASNVQESRCPYSLGSTKSDLGQVISTTPLLPTKGLLHLPKFKSTSNLRRPFDVNKSASNVEENVVSANRGIESLKLKPSSSKLSELLERTKSQILANSNIDGTKNDFSSPKVPNFRLNTLLKKNNNQTRLNANENKLKVNLVEHRIFPKINISKERTMLLDRVSDLDSSTSPSNVHKQFLKSLSQKSEKNNLNLFLEKDIKKKPNNLKSFFKLKDIELISNKPIKSKINIPSFKRTLLSQDAKNTNEPGSIEPSCGKEQRLETSIQKIDSKQIDNINNAAVRSSEKHSPLIETKRNIHEENVPDDFANSEHSTNQAYTNNESLETNNRDKEVYVKAEDFSLDNESANLGIHEGELKSSEREECSASTEITKNSDEIEGIDSVELPREDNLQNEDDNHDLFVDASNKDLHFIFQDNDHETEFQEKEVETNPEKNENFTGTKPFYNDVPTLKEKMLQKLEDLKDEIAHIKNARQTYLKSAESTDKDVTQNAMENDDADAQNENTNLNITTQEFISSTEIYEHTSSLDQIEENFKSLPKTSEFTISSKELNVEAPENIGDDSDEDPDRNPSASFLETTILDSVDSVNLPLDSEDNSKITDSNLLNGGKNQDMNKQLNSNENSLHKICMADMDKNVGIKTEDSNKLEEMSSQASESIPHVISQPSERQNTVVQPTSFFAENSIFRPLPGVPSLLNLDGHLPTLDEIRSSLSGILGIGPRETNEDDTISSEFQSAEDCSGAMSKGASITSSKSVFPNRRPVEDINFEIFQLTPKSQKGLFKTRAPSLNLNSYKTKLALPQNLGLKPLRLESSLGKNGNLFGATLTFGPKTIASSKSKISRPSSILNRARVPLGSTLPSLPDLDDIKSTMKARAEDLLNSPLSLAPSHTVQKVSELTDNLRSHTENTVKNIQQTLASTLSEARVKQIPFKRKFAKPSSEDLLEKISTAREDMNDKLKALHADLADRLSSIHENIAERTTLPTLQLPLFTQINRNPNPKFRTRPKSSAKSKASISNMRSKQAGHSNLKSSASRNTDEIKVKPFKISKAASTLTPKNVEVPILMTTSSKPPFAKPLQGDSIVKLKDSRLFESSMTKKPTPRNNVKLTKNNPSWQGRHALKHEFDSQRTTLKTPSAKDTLRKNANLGSKLRLDDSRGFASEVQPAIVPGPLRSSVSVTERTEPTQIARSKVKPLFSNKKGLGIPSQINDQVSRGLIHKPLPKIGDSTLLSKMRESLLSSHSDKPFSPKNNDDLTRSATENKKIEVKQEPLKENVKYRCRMICVKEPIK